MLGRHGVCDLSFLARLNLRAAGPLRMDLLSSRPFWPMRDGLPATHPALEGDAECEVLVIGAGIAGAMTAQLLAEAGVDVLVVDRREAAHGSTAGNTGLLLYELDVPLHRLARRLGSEPARRVFLRCRDAVRAMEERVRAARVECGFARRPSLYLAAARGHVAWLEREYALRRDAGLEVEWWSRARLRAASSLPHPAAILARESAQLDAYRLTYGLLQAAARRGARVHSRTAVARWRGGRNGVTARTSRGGKIRARHIVLATGYEAERFLPRRIGRLHSTFALATEPLEELTGWPEGGCMLWDTADPYLYLRTTADGRAIIGGYDEPFRDARRRDRLLGAKTAALKRRLKQFFPQMPFEVATSWAGTFGTTADGLPVIGQHREVPHVWFALGFGGNGTVFSLIAAEIIRAGILGERDPDAALFGFERFEAGATGRADAGTGKT